jgi:hypothetical protein
MEVYKLYYIPKFITTYYTIFLFLILLIVSLYFFFRQNNNQYIKYHFDTNNLNPIIKQNFAL